MGGVGGGGGGRRTGEGDGQRKSGGPQHLRMRLRTTPNVARYFPARSRVAHFQLWAYPPILIYQSETDITTVSCLYFETYTVHCDPLNFSLERGTFGKRIERSKNYRCFRHESKTGEFNVILLFLKTLL